MKKASPKMVGAFVIGAVAILLAAVVIFGTGRFFEEHPKAVAFFKESISGLRVGAPVEFRGIRIGTVTDIWVEIDPKTIDHQAPVIFEIEVGKIRGLEVDHDPVGDELIARGMRAQLSVQSFITGQKGILLNFFPDTPVELVETDLPYEQVPTVPAKFEQLEKMLDVVGEEAAVVLHRVGELLTEDNQVLIHEILENVAETTGELKKGSTNFEPMVNDLRALIHDAREEAPVIRELIDNANTTVLSYKGLADTGDAILNENRPAIKEAIAGVRRTEASIGRLSEEITKLVAENRRGIKDFSNEGLYEITNLAVDAQAGMEQIRRVFEEMERDPARFFLGKPGQVEVK